MWTMLAVLAGVVAFVAGLDIWTERQEERREAEWQEFHRRFHFYIYGFCDPPPTEAEYLAWKEAGYVRDTPEQ